MAVYIFNIFGVPLEACNGRPSDGRCGFQKSTPKYIENCPNLTWQDRGAFKIWQDDTIEFEYGFQPVIVNISIPDWHSF